MTNQESELIAAIRGVDADDDRARERGCTEPEQVVRHVLEEYTDVGWPVVVAELVKERRPAARLRHELAVRPHAVAQQQPDIVAAGTRSQQVGGSRHARPTCELSVVVSAAFAGIMRAWQPTRGSSTATIITTSRLTRLPGIKTGR